jgi:hypothetical protein
MFLKDKVTGIYAKVGDAGQLLIGNFPLEVSKENVAGHYTVNKFGSSSFIQETLTDVWDRDIDHTWLAPTDARIHQIESTSDEDAYGDGDNPEGDGARSIRVYGLQTWDAIETFEDVHLDGIDDDTNPVYTVESYVIIHRMKVLTTGSTGPFAQAGLIEATAAAPDNTVTAQIAFPKGQTQMAIYGVPSSQIFYMNHFKASIAHTSLAPTVADSSGVVILQSTDIVNNKTAYMFKHTAAVQDNGSTSISVPFDPPKIFEGPCIIKMAMVASKEDAFCDASFDGILVDN